MKRLLILSFLLTTACGSFLGENRRSLVVKTASGTEIRLSLSENRFPLTEKSYLIIKSASDYPLKGRSCEDEELKKFSDEVWSEVVKNEDLTLIKSATMMLEQRLVENKI